MPSSADLLRPFTMLRSGTLQRSLWGATLALLVGAAATPEASARQGASSRKSDNGLVLPSRPRAANDERRLDRTPDEVAPSGPALESGSPAVLAAKYLGDLAGSPGYDEQKSRLIAAQLLALGEDGLRAARAGLELDDLPTLVTSVRVLVSDGTELDQERLDVRLGRELPKGAAVPLVRALAGSLRDDRVERLVELLDHPQGAVRSAAERVLRDLESVDLLPELRLALQSKRSEARRAALTLMRDDLRPEVQELLIASLGDRSAEVAFTAAEVLGDRPAGALDAELEQLAFSTTIFDRNQCYALLALSLRAEGRGEPMVRPERRDVLLANLRGRDPLTTGVAAAALAGLGFRSAPNAEDGCRDEVPTALVQAVSGSLFHEDMTSLFDIARQRLVLISGVDHGEDGPAWRSWWREVGPTFRPRRAVIEVAPGEEQGLALLVRAGREGYALCGPDVDASADLGLERLLLSAEQAEQLFAAVELSGMLGLERASRTQESGLAERTIELRVAGQAKRLADSGSGAAWMDELLEVAGELRRANRWQRAFDPSTYGTRQEFMDAEAPFWRGVGDAAPSAEARRERLEELFTNALQSSRGAVRDGIVDELRELAAERPLGPERFSALLEALERELTMGPRVGHLVELALATAVLADGASPELPVTEDAAADADAPALGDPLGRSAHHLLYLRLDTLFGDRAQAELAQVVDSAGIDLARELVFESSPGARVLSASRLAKSPEAEDRALLAKLLEDRDSDVQCAALRAIGAEHRRLFQPAVAARAELAQPEVRAAALECLGALGGQDALGLLVGALSTNDTRVTAAAARGLAALGDPESATVLASLLSAGAESETFRAARQGLLDLGERAWPQLLSIARDPAAAMRREAAMILARQGVPTVLPVLIEMHELRQDDAELGYELSVLTGVDLRGDADGPQAYWNFWNTNAQDDSLEWLRASQLEAGISPLPIGGLQGRGTRGAALNLWRTLSTPNDLLAERARRVLGDLLEVELPELPARGAMREEWREQLLEVIDERWAPQ